MRHNNLWDDPLRDGLNERLQWALTTKAKYLDLSGLNLTDLPESIGNLTQLESLDISRNKLTSLPDSLGTLINLRELRVYGNQLTLLPEPIGNLKKLFELWLQWNNLWQLPKSLRELSQLKRFFLHGNEILGLPPEVLGPTLGDVINNSQRPARPADILDYYFRTIAGARPLNEAKLILVGRGGAGKTCLIKRLLHNTFDQHEKETPGIEIQSWEVKIPCGDAVRLHIWDFGGQEILHATHRFFLTERTLYLVVLSGREGKAGDDAEYWLQLIRGFGGDSKVIVVLNKSVGHPFDINRGFLIEKYPFIIDFVKTDCESNRGLDELKKLILRNTEEMEHRKADFPKDWFAIKERLAGMTKRNEDFVSWEQYQGICRDLGERDTSAQQKLAWYLNLLGIALNYRDDPRLKDTHVLNPRWVTEGIYPLLRAGQTEKRKGALELKDLSEILDAKRYPKHKHDFLLGLMEKFKLCFQLPEREGKPKQWLVPELLGENQPDIKSLLEEVGLGFRYQYDVLPEGLLPRFIVQTNLRSEANPQWRWRTGVVLEWDGCRAVVRADYRERRVDIHITGPEMRRRELLAVVREKFDEQHADLKGMTVDERVSIGDQPGVTVGYRDLLRREADGEEEFRPEGAQKKVRIAELLNGVENAESRAKRREREYRRTMGDTLIFNAPTTIQTGEKTMEKTTNINVQTNYGQVGEVLNHCTNIINQNSNGEMKKLLERLQGEVTDLIKALPPEGKQEAADNLKLLVDAATAEQPKRKWYSVSAEGLLEASKFTKEFAGNITGTIGQLGKLLWSDFKLPETEKE